MSTHITVKILSFAFIFLFSSTAVQASGWANNVIELRNDSIGGDFFEVRLGRAPYFPVYEYFLESTMPDEWKGTMGELVGIPMPMTPFWTIEVIYGSPDDYTMYSNFEDNPLPLFVDRHLPDVKLNPVLFSNPYDANTEGGTVSRLYGNQQEDHAYLLAKKEQILVEAGLTNDSSDFDKIMAVAQYIVQHVQGTDPRTNKQNAHPVDALEQGSHCIGRAHALIALATVMGLPARKLNWYNHTAAEVLIDGKWRYVENHWPWIRDIPEWLEQGPLFTYSFQELISDPVAHGIDAKTLKNMGNYNVHDKKGTIKGLPHYHLAIFDTGVYSNIASSSYQQGSGWHASSALELATLYPGESIMYKGWTGKRSVRLTPMQGIKYFTGVKTRRIMQGHGIRKPFYLSSLEGVQSVTASLLLDLSNSVQNMPYDGGDWYYQVNGIKFYLRDYGGWQVDSYFAKDVTTKGDWDYLTFDIPLLALSDTPCSEAQACLPIDEEPPTQAVEVLLDETFDSFNNWSSSGTHSACFDNWYNRAMYDETSYNFDDWSGNHIAEALGCGYYGDAYLTSIDMNTSEFDEVVIELKKYVSSNLGSNDFLRIEALGSDGIWDTLWNWSQDNEADSQWSTKSITLEHPAYLWNNFQIRLAYHGRTVHNQYVGVDDLVVTGILKN